MFILCFKGEVHGENINIIFITVNMKVSQWSVLGQVNIRMSSVQVHKCSLCPVFSGVVAVLSVLHGGGFLVALLTGLLVIRKGEHESFRCGAES